MQLQEVLELVCKELSENPDDIKVEFSLLSGIHCYCIEANQIDYKILVGKAGKNINALRTIAFSIAAKHKQRVNVLLKG